MIVYKCNNCGAFGATDKFKMPMYTSIDQLIAIEANVSWSRPDSNIHLCLDCFKKSIENMNNWNPVVIE